MTAPDSPLLSFDHRKSREGLLTLAGVDEAGRGSWAGPVVAAAVVLPIGYLPDGLDDSKRVPPRRREKLCQEIMASALDWGACAVSPEEIDKINILQATLVAMAGALKRLRLEPQLILVDGTHSPPGWGPCETVVRGDGTSAAIAAASILAKVLRDRIMVVCDRHFPGYGFAGHKGYGAASHRRALQDLGPSPVHRLSYRPLTDLDQGRLF